MLRRSNPPGPLGPTAAHIPASTFMLYTLTFRVFLLSVATSPRIMALEAFKKIQHRQMCTPGVIDCTPGISSLLCACALTIWAAVARYLRSAERNSAGQHEKDSIGLHIRESDRIRG